MPRLPSPRENNRQVFCEVCGYNFATRVSRFRSAAILHAELPLANGPPANCDRRNGLAERPVAAASVPTAASARSSAAGRTCPANRSNAHRAGNVRRPGCVGPLRARWELVLTVDANLSRNAQSRRPVGQPPRKFRLFDRETMIGRAGTEVRVQVPVHGDAGISRRQVLLIQGGHGSLLLRDSELGQRHAGVTASTCFLALIRCCTTARCLH